MSDADQKDSAGDKPASETKSDEEPMTEEEKYYSEMYTRVQYRKTYREKCSATLEAIEKLKIERMKTAQIDLGKYSMTNDLQAMSDQLDKALERSTNFDGGAEFFEHTDPPYSQAKEFLQNNVDLKVQRLVRQTEEIKEVKVQQERREQHSIHKILHGDEGNTRDD